MKVSIKKKAKAGLAATLAVAIALAGTFAWQSISQHAINEMSTPNNPGGRLHDDFNGEVKKVYAENFTGTGDGVPVFVRIKLNEYMEIGQGAGLKTGDEGYDSKNAASVLGVSADGVTPDINDSTTWTTRKPGASVTAVDLTDPIQRYLTWGFGGDTVYMPTFNKNKDSLRADINGTYEGTGSGVRYDDYVEYKLDDTKNAKAEYDADPNDTDEGDTAQENVNFILKDETHTAKSTLPATALTMQEWIDAGKTAGNFWVWDTDGWVYWANPVKPGEATGCFINQVKKAAAMPTDDWYYAIDVVAQFITADDMGGLDATGFYADNETVSSNALELLKKIGVDTTLATLSEVDTDGYETPLGADPTVRFAASGDDTSHTFKADSKVIATGLDWTWTILPATDPGFEIEASADTGDRDEKVTVNRMVNTPAGKTAVLKGVCGDATVTVNLLASDGTEKLKVLKSGDANGMDSFSIEVDASDPTTSELNLQVNVMDKDETLISAVTDQWTWKVEETTDVKIQVAPSTDGAAKVGVTDASAIGDTYRVTVTHDTLGISKTVTISCVAKT